MNPFHEATADQLARLVKILDVVDERANKGIVHFGFSVEFFLNWADGVRSAAIDDDKRFPTEDVIRNWEEKLDLR